MIVIDN